MATTETLKARQPASSNERFDLAKLEDINRSLSNNQEPASTRAIQMANISEKTTFRYPEPSQIKDLTNTVLSELKSPEAYKAMDKQSFAETMANTYKELEAVRPFAEKSTETTQRFVSEIAKQTGYVSQFDKVDQTQLKAATEAAIQGRPQQLNKIVNDAIIPERAIAFETMPKQTALQKFPELEGAYSKLERFESPASSIKQATVEPVKTERSIALQVNPITRTINLEATSKSEPAAQAAGRAEMSNSPPAASEQQPGQSKQSLIQELRAGQIPADNTPKEKSRDTIQAAAKDRGLVMREANQLSSVTDGTIVAQSEKYYLVQVGRSIGVAVDKQDIRNDSYVGQNIAMASSAKGLEVVPAELKQSLQKSIPDREYVR